jgi:hypothetical protein
LSFRWNPEDFSLDGSAADVAAINIIEGSCRKIVEGFTELLLESSNLRDAYAAIYTKIVSSCPSGSEIQSLLFDALTIAVAATHLQRAAQDSLEEFNCQIESQFINPIHQQGYQLTDALQKAMDSDTDPSTLIETWMRLMAEITQYDYQIRSLAHQAARTFVTDSPSIIEFTHELVLPPIASRALRGIGQVLQKTQARVERSLGRLADDHCKFLAEASADLEALFLPDHAA